MKKLRYNKISFYFNLIFKINHLCLFLFLISIQIKGVFLVYFESLQTDMLNEEASLIDISDYHNLSLIITTDKKIYNGIPPTLKSTTNSSIINISSAVTYNNNYILMACTENYLLSKIDIETGEESPLINYENISLPNYTCSISSKDDYVYISFSYIIIPKYIIQKFYYNNTDNNNETNENIETDDIYNNTSNNTNSNDIANEEAYLQNFLKKIKLVNHENEPFLNRTFNILNYIFEFKEKYLNEIIISFFHANLLI